MPKTKFKASASQPRYTLQQQQITPQATHNTRQRLVLRAELSSSSWSHLDRILGSTAVAENTATHSTMVPPPDVREGPCTSWPLAIAHILIIHPSVLACGILARPAACVATAVATASRRPCRRASSPASAANDVEGVRDRCLPGAPSSLVFAATNKRNRSAGAVDVAQRRGTCLAAAPRAVVPNARSGATVRAEQTHAAMR